LNPNYKDIKALQQASAGGDAAAKKEAAQKLIAIIEKMV
jgi:hypothetical protein